MEYWIFFCRCSLCIVFLWSLGAKLRDFQAFTATITSFRILPPAYSRATAVCGLLAEASVAVMLAAGGAALGPGFALAIVLLAGFTAAMASALTRGLSIGCNCFGKKRATITYADLVRNLGLIAVGVSGAVLHARTGASPGPAAAELIVVALFALVVTAVWVQLKELLYLFRA